MRICTLCNQEKEDSCFYQRKKENKTGWSIYWSPYCKDCEKVKAKNHKKKRYHDPETRGYVLGLTHERTKKPEFKEKHNAKFRNKYANDPGFKQRILNNRACERVDPERKIKLSKRKAKYYQNHKREIIEKELEKTRNDPKRKIRGYMRSRINEVLKKSGNIKGGVSSLKYLNYTWDDFYRHLESQFEDWMNFSNHGPYNSDKRTWQVDHIIPQIYFPYDSMDSDMFRMCWDLKNLRPLDSEVNLREGDRTYLFNGFNDINQIFKHLRAGLDFSCDKNEILKSVEYLKNVEPVGELCPMSMTGLSYLDSIFTARFRAKSVRHESFFEAFDNDQKLFEAIIYAIKKDKNVTSKEMASNIRYSVKTPGHFFPSAAVSIIKKYSNSGDVFDPFLGWGGRVLGAICSNVSSYEGCDLQSDVVDSCEKVARDLESLSDTKCYFHFNDCLEFLRRTNKEYDLIFTSPPYLDSEDYGVESDSMKENWVDDFCFPLALEFSKHLKKGGKLALHLKDIKGSPAFTAYHSAVKSVGFKLINKHGYNRNWTQSIFVYEL